MNQYEINEFPKEVINEIKYYVYRLIDPRDGETFYIGKGKGNRVFQHMKCALDVSNIDEINEKIQTIRGIIAAGLNVIHVIHRHGMDEQTARDVEAALIDAYPGASNIASGLGSSDYGPMNALEIITKYAAEEAVFKHKILIIIINKSIAKNSIYDATRFAWKINKKKAERAKYVLAVMQGLIVGVFKVYEWKEAIIRNFPEFHLNRPGRYGFVGEEAEDNIKQMYIRKRVPDIYRKKGAANPIKYSF